MAIPQIDLLKEAYLAAKDAYYSGKPIMSDSKFDKLEDQIKAVDPKWKGLSSNGNTGAPIKNKKTKVKLPIPIFSLDKVKIDDADRWLGKQKGSSVVLSDKLDGGSLELIYEGGSPTRAITRGNGIIGGDVSFLIPHLRIPQRISSNKTVILRCETLFSTAKFQKYKGEFDAARNAATGVFNRSDAHPALKDIDVVVLQVLEPNVKPSVGLAWAKKQKFHTVFWTRSRVDDLNGIRLDKLLRARKAHATQQYQIDGLVITLDNHNALPKNGNPDWSVAFKANISTEDAPTGTVRAVVWDVSPHGYLVPRVELETPIRLGDSAVRFASAYNAKYVQDNKLGAGAKVKMVRSGDIIPKIVEVIKTAKPQWPDRKQFGDYDWDKTKVNLILTNPKDNAVFRSKRITRFYIGIGVDGLKQGTVERLVNAGYDNITKINKLTVAKIAAIEGFKTVSATKLYENIHKVIDKPIPLIILMDASGVFPRGIGETRLESISQHYDLIKLASMSVEEVTQKISKIATFQDKTAERFAQGVTKFGKWLTQTGLQYEAVKKPTKQRAGPWSGMFFSFTGYRSAEQEAAIMQKGGTVVPFGSKTTVLLYSPTGKASSKVDAAKKKGIKVTTFDKLK